MNDPANGNVVTRRWLTEKHRETSGEHDKRFLLFAVHVTLAVRAGLIAPDICPSVLEVNRRLELRYVPGRLPVLVWAGGPSKLFGPND